MISVLRPCSLAYHLNYSDVLGLKAIFDYRHILSVLYYSKVKTHLNVILK